MSYFYDEDENKSTRKDLIKKVKILELEKKISKLQDEIGLGELAIFTLPIYTYAIIGSVLLNDSIRNIENELCLPALGFTTAALSIFEIPLCKKLKDKRQEKKLLENELNKYDNLTIGYTSVTYTEDDDYEVRTEITKVPKKSKK